VTVSNPAQAASKALEDHLREIREEHPPFVDALIADARIAAIFRAERHEFRSRFDGVLQALRLMAQTDAFFALAAYRAKASLQARRVPVLPWIAQKLAMASAQVSIADTVVVQPGIFIPHGQVVVSGLTEISQGVSIFPWVTVGPAGGKAAGPKLGPGVIVGTGAKVVGDVEVGANARIGVNAVVLDDVPPSTTVVGMPARPVED
jgi:serine O-acetyltransferase